MSQTTTTASKTNTTTSADKAGARNNTKTEATARRKIRTYQNLSSPPIQAKLTIGAVDDPMEREADIRAEHVMRMPDPVLAGASNPGDGGSADAGAGTGLARKTRKKGRLQRKELPETDEMLQEKPLLQRETADEAEEIPEQPAGAMPEEILQEKPLIQREALPDEEAKEQLQTKPLLQRNELEEEEEEVDDFEEAEPVEEAVAEDAATTDDEIQTKPLAQADTMTTTEVAATSSVDVPTPAATAPAQPIVQRETMDADSEESEEEEQADERVKDLPIATGENDDEIKTKPLLQREALPEDEMKKKPLLQRQAGMPDEEMKQKPSLQRETAKPDEEMKQKPLLQRQAGMPDEEMRQKPLLQRQAAEPDEEIKAKPLVQRQATDKEDEIKPKSFLQREAASSSAPTVTPEISSQVYGLRGRGSQMAPVDQSFFAPRMPDIDVSQVRVHSDSSSQQLARSVNARAFTFENNVVMGQGEYSPGSDSGRRLMAHELTHVAQQGKAPNLNRKVKSGAPVQTSAVQAKVQRKEGVVQRAPRRSPFNLRAAIRFNWKHKYNAAMVDDLKRVAGPKAQGDYSTVRRTKRLGAPFARMVYQAQVRLGFSRRNRDGKLGDTTIEVAQRFLRGRKSRRRVKRSKPGFIARGALRAAIFLLKGDRFPLGVFGPFSAIGNLVRHAAIGFLKRLARSGGETVWNSLKNLALSLIEPKFMKGIFFGFLKGFFVEGIWGTIKLLWEIVKFPVTLVGFAKNVVKFLGDVDLVGALGDLGKEIKAAGRWVSRNGPGLVEHLIGKVRGANVGGMYEFFKNFSAKARGMARKFGSKMAEQFLKLFGKSKVNFTEKQGESAGKVAGEFTFDVVLSVFTGGAGGAARAILKRIMGRALRIIVRARRSMRKLFNSAAANALWLVNSAQRRLVPLLSKISGKLATAVKNLFGGIRRFINNLKTRFRQGRRKPGKDKPKDKKKEKDKNRKPINMLIRLPFHMMDEPHQLIIRVSSIKEPNENKVIMKSAEKLLSVKANEALRKLKKSRTGNPANLNQRITTLEQIEKQAKPVEKLQGEIDDIFVKMVRLKKNSSKYKSLEKRAQKKGKEMREKGGKLASKIAKYGSDFGQKDILGIANIYPAPAVGIHKDIRKVDERLPDGTTRESHHVPGKQLATSLAGVLKETLPTIRRRNKKTAEMISDMIGRLEEYAEDEGNKLPAIRIHSKTHKLDTDIGFTAHGGPKLREKLPGELDKLNVKHRLTKQGGISTNPRDPQFRGLITDQAKDITGNENEQAKTKQVVIDAISQEKAEQLIRAVYRSASIQGRTAVELAVKKSSLDGPWSVKSKKPDGSLNSPDRKTALSKLKNLIGRIWISKVLFPKR